MKTIKIIFRIILVLVISSCVSKSDYDKLKTENQKLKRELEECEHGAEKLATKIEMAYSGKDYTLARKNIELLKIKHPEFYKVNEFETLLLTIEKEEKEFIRLQNLNNTGMWEIRYFVDDFGEKTNDGYITSKSLLKGTFSNSATQNSSLLIYPLISKWDEFKKLGYNISFQLYEYSRNNPVKGEGSYKVLVQDKNGKRYNLEGDIRRGGDRLIIKIYYMDNTNGHNRILHKILLMGGEIKFVIKEKDALGVPSEYKFTIENADYYNNAIRLLNEVK